MRSRPLPGSRRARCTTTSQARRRCSAPYTRRSRPRRRRAEAIPRYDRSVLLVWGESCDFFPISDARRLASEFPDATLFSVPEAKTWVPVDDPGAVADAIVEFVPTWRGE
jgi:pimeloyl-ACP methyl ester carboxylesterase